MPAESEVKANITEPQNAQPWRKIQEMTRKHGNDEYGCNKNDQDDEIRLDLEASCGTGLGG